MYFGLKSIWRSKLVILVCLKTIKSVTNGNVMCVMKRMGAIKIQTTQFLKFFSSAGYIWQYFFEGRITVSVNTFTYLSIFSFSFALSCVCAEPSKAKRKAAQMSARTDKVKFVCILDTETLVKVTMRGDKSVRGPHKGER
jgi:hypothetical protein